MPPRNATGTKTAASTKVVAMTGPCTSSMAISVALSAGRSFSTMLRSTFSMTTMASSTTRPMASTIAKSVSVLMENPSTTNAPKVAISDTGMASAGTSVARQFCRNRYRISVTRISASMKVSATSWIDARIYLVLSTISMYFRSGGKSFSASRMTSCTPRTVSMALASLVSWMPKPMPTCPLDMASTATRRAPVSMRAISFMRTKEPLASERTMMLAKSSSVTRRPATRPVYCFSSEAGAGCMPMVPAGACTFWLLMALVTSAMEIPSSAILSGFSQRRIA